MEEQVIALAGMTVCSCKLQDLLLGLLHFLPPPIQNYLSVTKTSCLLCVITTYHLEKRREENSLLLGNSM